MFRPRVSRVHLLGPALVAVALGAACSSPNSQEENFVRQYFRASGLRDNNTLSNFAVVTFDPQKNGKVTNFEITSVSEPRTEPLRLIELREAVQDAEGANKEFVERKRVYQSANMDAINRVLKAEASGQKLSGRDVTVQAEWTRWRAETLAESKKVSAARTALSSARPVAELSLMGQGGAVPSLEELVGTVESKDVMIDATVEPPGGGASSQKQLVVTLSRAIQKNAAGERTGKWVITSVKPA
jgi:hypothetical protein